MILGAILAGGQARRFGSDKAQALYEGARLIDRVAAALAAALRHAEAGGFSHVLSAGVDAPDLPHDLAATLAGEGAAIVESQPVVGLWPVATGPALEAFLGDGGRSLYRFADAIDARRVELPTALMNVNRPEDLPPA